MIKDEDIKTLRTGLDKLSIELNEDKIELIIRYLRYLLQANSRHNLIGTEETNEVIKKHILDCLCPLALPEMFKISGPLLDLGTGAGLPGILWSIVRPDIDIYLLDSRRKKIDFLRNTQKRLKLNNCYPLQERAEVLGQDSDFREKFEIVTARAVASTNVLLEYSLPFLKISGKAILFKGPSYQNELDNTEAVSEKLGGSDFQLKEISVPGLQAKRFILLVEKIRETPPRFPRNTGVPKKRPL